MNSILAWFITFNFVNIAWVFFRAKEWDDAIKVLKGMFGFSGVVISDKSLAKLSFMQDYISSNPELFGRLIYGSTPFSMLLLAIFIVTYFKNSNQYKDNFRPSYKWLLLIVVIDIYTILNLSKVSEFLYFNF